MRTCNEQCGGGYACCIVSKQHPAHLCDIKACTSCAVTKHTVCYSFDHGHTNTNTRSNCKYVRAPLEERS